MGADRKRPRALNRICSVVPKALYQLSVLQGQSVLSVYILDPEIEDMVRGAIKQTSAGSYLASTQILCS